MQDLTVSQGRLLNSSPLRPTCITIGIHIHTTIYLPMQNTRSVANIIIYHARCEALSVRQKRCCFFQFSVHLANLTTIHVDKCTLWVDSPKSISRYVTHAYQRLHPCWTKIMKMSTTLAFIVRYFNWTLHKLSEKLFNSLVMNEFIDILHKLSVIGSNL